jgi:hypothetical protein
MPSKPKLHPDQTAAELLDHVLYEMHMMLWAYLRFLHRNPPFNSKEEASAHLECFITHVRCLSEFFNRPKAKATDLRPWDISTKFPELTKEGPQKADHPQLDRMNREIAHLTTDRKKRGVSDGKGHWHIPDVAKPVFGDSLKFLLAVQDDDELMRFGHNARLTANLIAHLRGQFTPEISTQHVSFITPGRGDAPTSTGTATESNFELHLLKGGVPTNAFLLTKPQPTAARSRGLQQ